MRKTGIEVVGDAPWGTHFCQFYATKDDLRDILVPYFKAGLESDEYCMWVTAPPLGVEEAWDALGRAMPDLDSYRRRGRIEILPHTEWYLLGGKFDPERVLAGWVSRLEGAVALGCAGLRLTGNTFWLERPDWKSFAEYESAVDAVIGRYRMIALCTYAIDHCGASEVADVIRNHQFALIKRDGRWELFQSFDRQRMQDALVAERERLSSALSNMLDGFAFCRMLYDDRGRPDDFVFLEVNAAFERLTGLRDVVGRRVSEVVPGVREAHPDLIETCGRVVGSGRPERFEVDFRPLDMWLSVSVYSPQPDHIISIFDDVTVRKRGEEHIHRQNALLRGIARIFEEALTCETEADLGRVCLSVAEQVTQSKFAFIGEVNRKSRKLEDIAISDPGWNACRMHAASGHDKRMPAGFEIRGLYGRVLLDGKGFYTNDPASHPDSIGTPAGHPPLRSFLGVPLLHSGTAIGLVALANREGGYGPEDLAAAEALAAAIVQALLRTRAEEEVKHANAQLTEAGRRKDEFLGMLSHELRNPLAPIRNSIYILEHAEAGGEQARQASAVIRRQAEHLTRLVDDLLDVTRIARGKIELKRGRVDLTELVRRAGEDHSALMRERGIELSVAVPEGRMCVDGDSTRLSQVIGNLLHNSAKFTARGGKVELSLGSESGAAEIRVCDNGAGIEHELLERLFEPFVQGDRALAKKEAGLGLGLALVKGITELHGGSVQASSEGPGRGAVLVVRLPLVEASAVEDSPGRRTGRTGASRRVLVVDDNEDAARSLAELIGIFGHTAEVAHDGPSAIAAARENPPDFVFCDLELPGMSGYEVVRALRNDDILRKAVVFALSGYAQPDDRRRAVEAGFDGHLAKPSDPELIEDILSRRG